MTRPVIDGKQPPEEKRDVAPPQRPAVPSAQPFPLAGKLPSWDLLPAHSMLVRRRVRK